MVPVSSMLANVDAAMNAVEVRGDAVGPTLYYGAGAGELPTARAVVADARAQAGTDVTMGEKAVRLALKKGEAFSREDSKPPKYQLHE